MAKKSGMYLLMNMDKIGTCKILDTSDGSIDTVSLYTLSDVLNKSELRIYGLRPLSKVGNINKENKLYKLKLALDAEDMIQGWFYFYRQQGYTNAKAYAYAQFGFDIYGNKLEKGEQQRRLQKYVNENQDKKIWFK